MGSNNFKRQLFVVDVMIKFNTAFYRYGEYHEARDKIFKHYLRGELALDLIVAVP